MGMYSECVNMNLSLRHIWGLAEAYDLPKPRECEHDSHAMHWKLRDVRKWVSAAEESDNFHVNFVGRLLYEHMSQYITRVGREAPKKWGRKRLKYFQRMSRKYRFYFL